MLERSHQNWAKPSCSKYSSYGCTKDRIRDLKKEEENEDIWFKLKHDTL